MTEQKICIKFCVKNEIKCNEVVKMLEKTFGKNALPTPKVIKYYKRFQAGGTEIKREKSAERQSAATDESLKQEI